MFRKSLGARVGMKARAYRCACFVDAERGNEGRAGWALWQVREGNEAQLGDVQADEGRRSSGASVWRGISACGVWS